MRVHLTDRFCAHASSKEAQTDYFDETITGLALRVTSGGTKSFTLTWGAPRRRTTLGRYPSMSLAAARTAAIGVKEGRTSGTVAALAEVYLRHIGSLRSAPEIERRLRHDILPVIGPIPLTELHRRDITRIIDGKADAPIAARRAFEDIRGMIRWAVARGDLDHNPIDGIRGPPISRPRTRVLSDDEIRTIWRRFDEIRPDVGRVIRFCLATAQRIGEVTGLTPGELDLERRIWNIPASRSKNGYAHSVPLSQMALDIIDSIKGNWHGAGGVGSNTPVFGVSRNAVADFVWRHQFGFPRWSGHDCRRTALTKMAELGIAPVVLGHIANHRTTTKAGITLAIYVHYPYESEKRAALELWADRLAGIISGSGKVIALRR